MNLTKSLNAYHRTYVKRMRRSAQRHPKQPPMSAAELMALVQRLQQSRHRKQSAAQREPGPP